MKNERGLTLIEVLAATAIGIIFILLIGNALLFGLKQYKNQSIKAQELTDVTFVAKVITKEIRKATIVSISKDGNSIRLTIDDQLIEYKFSEENSSILKNGDRFFSGIKLFDISRDEDRSKMLEIEIVSPNKNGLEERIDTEIYLRKDVNIDEH